MVAVVSVLISLPILLFCTYYFQIKEYRLDRALAGLKDIRLGLYLPAKTIRNLLVFGLSVVVVYRLPILGVLVSPIVVYFAVVLTSPLAWAKRQRIVTKAKAKLADSNVVVIGITGSYGKSSTKEYLHAILSAKYKTAKTLENHNTLTGVGLDVLSQIQPDTRYFVAEVGAYTRGEIRSVVSWLKPTYGILTGIGNQHLDLFGSQENLVLAKKELLQALNANGVAYINSDNAFVHQLTDGLSCKLKFFSNKDDLPYKLNILGGHARLNVLPCVMLAKDLGMSDNEIRSAVEKLRNRFGNLSTHTGLNSAKFVFDGKNSNVNGFLSAISSVDNLNYVVSKGIIELGDDQASAYKQIREKLNEDGVQLLTTDKKFGGEYFKNESDILDYLSQYLKSTDTVLIEGKFTSNFVKSLGIKNA